MFRPPEAETCRLIIKIPYISCNKLFSNSCLVINLNYYKFVVLDVHTLLFGILISTTGMIHLNKNSSLYFPLSYPRRSRGFTIKMSYIFLVSPIVASCFPIFHFLTSILALCRPLVSSVWLTVFDAK